jgi:hypothetical protein
MAVPHPDRSSAFQAGTGARPRKDREHAAKYGTSRACVAHYAAVLAVRTAVQGGGG